MQTNAKRAKKGIYKLFLHKIQSPVPVSQCHLAFHRSVCNKGCKGFNPAHMIP